MAAARHALGRLRVVWVALAALYLALIWLDSIGTSVPALVPQPPRFFCQVAQLFPRAAEQIIEWHVKGFRCNTHRFEEIDIRPAFPIHPDDKENTFERAMFFYLKNRRVLHELDLYLSGALGERFGGVMLMSVRLPIPEPGQVTECHHRRPLDAEVGERHYWYVTDPDEREHRCAE
jgi:hypothetical protein